MAIKEHDKMIFKKFDDFENQVKTLTEILNQNYKQMNHNNERFFE